MKPTYQSRAKHQPGKRPYRQARTKIDRSRLHYALYNAARRCVHIDYQNDAEAVKTKRDNECGRMFGKPYDELTNGEIADVINSLDIQSGTIAPPQVQKPLASKQRLKMLRFYMTSVGLHYHDFSDAEYVDLETGEVYKGEDLRIWLQRRHDNKTGWIPNSLYRRLYEEWINPKSHQFMIEGGYKEFTRKPARFSYEHLSPDEAEYLIRRYKMIYHNIEMPIKAHEINDITTTN